MDDTKSTRSSAWAGWVKSIARSTRNCIVPFRWLPDSRALAYLDTQKGVTNGWALPLDGGKPKQLTDFTSGQIYSFDLARDGKPTLFSRGITNRDVVLISGFR